MSRYLITLFCLIHTLSFGQPKDKFSLALQFTPEITNHLSNYAYHSKDAYSTITFNCGIQALLQYELSKNIFIQGGLGYIPRKINTTVIFNHHAIPPPRQSFTDELVHATQVTYRTIEIPLLIGYNIEDNQQLKWFINAGVIGNFVPDAHYVTSFKKYGGTYDKNYWQGYSLQVGTGIDFKISNTIWATIGASGSLVNTVKKDPYLYSHGDEIALTHAYQNLSVGIKIPLDN